MIHLPLHREREEEEEWIHLAQAIIQMLRVRLDRTYFTETENWKYYSKIIFKCVNNAVWPIFYEKVVEKWSLWILWIVRRTHKLMTSGWKVRNIRLLFMNNSCIFLTFEPLFINLWVLCTIHRIHKLQFSATFSLKMGHIALFTHLKIILLQCFQFSVSAK